MPPARGEDPLRWRVPAQDRAPPAPPSRGSSDQAIAAWVKRWAEPPSLSDGRLRAINLSSTSLSDAQLAYLESAQLAETRSSGDAGLRPRSGPVQRLTGLRELNLSNTTVSDTGLPKLAALTTRRLSSSAGTLVEGPGLSQLGRPDRAARTRPVRLPSGDRGLSEIGSPCTGLRRLRLVISISATPVWRTLPNSATSKTWTSAAPKSRDEGLKQIAALTSLRELYLNYTGYHQTTGLPRLNHCSSWNASSCSAPAPTTQVSPPLAGTEKSADRQARLHDRSMTQARLSEGHFPKLRS